MSKYEKTKIFMLGMIVALLTIYLVGNNTNTANANPNNEVGRYQIVNLGGSYILAIDTKTGNYFINSRQLMEIKLDKESYRHFEINSCAEILSKE